MAWIQLETDKFENGSGWILERDGMFGWILYHEDIEDEFPDTFIVLADLFSNPGLGVVTLDPVTNKVPIDKMPPIAINDIFTVNSQVAQLALIAQRGDIAIRSDLPGPAMFILAGDDPAYLQNWIPITTTYPDWNNIQNKPASFPPGSHNHDTSYYTKPEVDTALAGKRSSATPIPATDITPDSTHRFVTDAEKATWNAAGGGLSNPLNQDINFAVGKCVKVNTVPTPTPVAGWLDDGTPYYIKKLTYRLNNGVTSGSIAHGISLAGTNNRIFGFEYMVIFVPKTGGNNMLLTNFLNSKLNQVDYDDTLLTIIRSNSSGPFDFVITLKYT